MADRPRLRRWLAGVGLVLVAGSLSVGRLRDAADVVLLLAGLIAAGAALLLLNAGRALREHVSSVAAAAEDSPAGTAELGPSDGKISRLVDLNDESARG